MNPSYDPLDRIATDPDAFEAFYRDHLDAVHTFVARRVAHPHSVADLTADIFLAAIEAAPSYDPRKGAVMAWLYGVGRNTLAAEVRRRRREALVARRIAGHRLLDESSLARIEERLDAEREWRRIFRAVSRLKGEDRALLELAAIDGMSIAAAAQRLGLEPGTARVRLHRSRSRVKELVETPAHKCGDQPPTPSRGQSGGQRGAALRGEPGQPAPPSSWRSSDERPARCF